MTNIPMGDQFATRLNLITRRVSHWSTNMAMLAQQIINVKVVIGTNGGYPHA